MLVEALQRHVGDFVDGGAVGRFVAREHHVRLQQRAAEVDSLVMELRVHPLEDAAGHNPALRDRVRAVLQDLGLDDRDETGLLAKGCVAGERVSVRPDGVLARLVRRDRVGRPPLREARAELPILLEPVA